MENFKIQCTNQEELRLIQEYLFDKGFVWNSGSNRVLFKEHEEALIFSIHPGVLNIWLGREYLYSSLSNLTLINPKYLLHGSVKNQISSIEL